MVPDVFPTGTMRTSGKKKVSIRKPKSLNWVGTGGGGWGGGELLLIDGMAPCGAKATEID